MSPIFEVPSLFPALSEQVTKRKNLDSLRSPLRMTRPRETTRLSTRQRWLPPERSLLFRCSSRGVLPGTRKGWLYPVPPLSMMRSRRTRWGYLPMLSSMLQPREPLSVLRRSVRSLVHLPLLLQQCTGVEFTSLVLRVIPTYSSHSGDIKVRWNSMEACFRREREWERVRPSLPAVLFQFLYTSSCYVIS